MIIYIYVYYDYIYITVVNRIISHSHPSKIPMIPCTLRVNIIIPATGDVFWKANDPELMISGFVWKPRLAMGSRKSIG